MPVVVISSDLLVYVVGGAQHVGRKAVNFART